jgi:hypothetical protein
MAAVRQIVLEHRWEAEDRQVATTLLHELEACSGTN